MSDGVWICNAEPRLLWVNRACESLNNIRAGEVCGRRGVGAALDRQFRPRCHVPGVAPAPRGGHQPARQVRSNSAGQRRTLFNDAEITHVVGTERDLTELNRLRDELDQSREITRKISSELLALKLKDSRLADIIAESEPMQRVVDTALKLAQFDSTLLLTGPSGTGKSMIAKLIHEQSARRDRPLLSLNCGALLHSLLEAELFGYADGAFRSPERGQARLWWKRPMAAVCSWTRSTPCPPELRGQSY
ncbi:MAG: sigma 54-interacting transcriptional regulator [Gammaproteobacteria bacterium]|nr:sigma 54-interacting transcriptional regulator [Gammaproteobacteria bacterium]